MSDTIFMIHGMWGGGWYWENYRQFFEERGFQYKIPTLRFHDIEPDQPAPPELGTVSLLDYAADLETEIQQLESPPILMGHSMGGLLAQILGSKGLAKALVLLTPASPAGILALRPSVIKSFRSSLFRWGFWKKPHRPTFDEAVYSMMHLLPESEQKEMYANLVYESGRAAAEIGFWLFDPQKAAKVDEIPITCPVLVIAGAEDRITPSSVTRKVAEKYKAVATFKEFPEHAHWIIGEPGWEEVAGYVFDWLTKTVSE
ncbi:alpha/beta fold hydrolase [Candidatus Saccharibacteria bacterium]|nr:alpha/beta fold hydrolase [Calditrichia bacterium]NIV71690.1 alpha/beta fold hydrolase [Calditrichia bacterium]NIV98797.1 alpha/beta fold hydrolase [Candidatus Saccharibacteria bacterium]NIW78624.1 alpha/beta fold hydrolase [Calditrichia bacterium]